MRSPSALFVICSVRDCHNPTISFISTTLVLTPLPSRDNLRPFHCFLAPLIVRPQFSKFVSLIVLRLRTYPLKPPIPCPPRPAESPIHIPLTKLYPDPSPTPQTQNKVTVPSVTSEIRALTVVGSIRKFLVRPSTRGGRASGDLGVPDRDDRVSPTSYRYTSYLPTGAETTHWISITEERDLESQKSGFSARYP